MYHQGYDIGDPACSPDLPDAPPLSCWGVPPDAHPFPGSWGSAPEVSHDEPCSWEIQSFCARLSSRVSAEMEGPVLSLAHWGPCCGCSWNASGGGEAVATELLASWQVWGWLADASGATGWDRVGGG